jgi:hypothetical protein
MAANGFPLPIWRIPKKVPACDQGASTSDKVPIPSSRQAVTRCEPVTVETEDLTYTHMYTLLDSARNAAIVGIVLTSYNYSQDVDKLQNLDKVVNFSAITPNDKTITNYLQMISTVTSLSLIKSVLGTLNKMPYDIIINKANGEKQILRASYFRLMLKLGLIDKTVKFNQLQGEQLVADYYTHNDEFDKANFQKFMSIHLQFADIVSYLVKLPKHVSVWESMGTLRIMLPQTAYTIKGKPAMDRTMTHVLAEVTTLGNISLFHGKGGEFLLPQEMWDYSDLMVETLMEPLKPWFRVDKDAMTSMMKRQLHINNPVMEILKYCVDWQKTYRAFDERGTLEYELVPAINTSNANGRLKQLAKSKHDPRHLFQPRYMQQAVYVKNLNDIESKFYRYWNSGDYSSIFLMPSTENPAIMHSTDRITGAIDFVSRQVSGITGTSQQQTHDMARMVDKMNGLYAKVDETFVNTEATHCAVMELSRGQDDQPKISNKQLSGIHHKLENETKTVMDTLDCVKEYLKSQSSALGKLQVLTEYQGKYSKDLANVVRASVLLQKQQATQIKSLIETVKTTGFEMMVEDTDVPQGVADVPQNDAEVKGEDVSVPVDAAITLEAKDKEIDIQTSEVMEDQATEIEQSDKAYGTEYPAISVSSTEPPKVPLAIRKQPSTRRKGSEPDSKRQKSNEESK